MSEYVKLSLLANLITAVRKPEKCMQLTGCYSRRVFPFPLFNDLSNIIKRINVISLGKPINRVERYLICCCINGDPQVG